VHVVREKSLSDLVTSIVKIVSSGGLTDSSNVFDSGASLFFHSVSDINFLMFWAFIENPGDLL